MFDKIITRIEKAVMLTSYITLILVVSLETLRRMLTGHNLAGGQMWPCMLLSGLLGLLCLQTFGTTISLPY